ncbi:MAG: 2-hydroxyacid dehydrogenase [Actinomycetota bacterium]|nr:2-hydroxyacid dehydrogenase [Actinomycetota bacterium]
MKVWLPMPDAVQRMGGLPEGLDVDVYDGEGELPDSAEEVEFYVPPYLAGGHVYELVRDLPSLKVVQTLTAGVDNIRPHVPPHVTLCNARGVHDASTAELTVLLMLASLRGLPGFVRAQEQAQWASGRFSSLADKTVLIIGHGSIGAALERRLDGFEVAEVLRVARRARDGVAALADLPDLLPRADVVVLLVPMTEQTRGLADAAFLARMKDGALLVNVARGPVVDTGALVAEVRTGRLRAALDVTDPEPLPPDSPLWSQPGVLISPHVGGNSDAFVPRALRLVREQLDRYAAGRPLANVVAGDY